MTIFTASRKGRRPQNEDNHVIYFGKDNNSNNKSNKNINIFGLFDGHGGKEISAYLSSKIPEVFSDNNLQHPLTGAHIKKIYSDIDNEIEKDMYNIGMRCGSTALIALIYKVNSNKFLDILNTGDCRAVLYSEFKNPDNTITSYVTQMTKDHKPDDPIEKKRIEDKGGIVELDTHQVPRVVDLSLSRAFGDINAKPYVTSEPERKRIRLSKSNKFLIMACDGLWDVMSNEDVVTFIKQHLEIYKQNKKYNIAKQLANHAIHNLGSMDNVSIMIILF
jgi:serine/threonine protein phosphatase PrpC